jgi:hypothetical protein
MPNNRVECVICDAPNADTLIWGEVRTIDFGLTLSRPVVTHDGAWLFLSGVTQKEVDAREPSADCEKAKGLYVYETCDCGETFTLKSKPFGDRTAFEAISAIEKVIFSRPNGVDIVGKYFYTIYAQVPYGIAKLVSPDGGVGFRAEADSAYGSYFSQFDAVTIGPIEEKKFLLVNNMHFGEGGRMCLCALFSNNRGDSYQGVLELESVNNKAYLPDIAPSGDEMLVAYEREGKSGAHEIVLAKFTEADVLAGTITNAESYIGRVVE